MSEPPGVSPPPRRRGDDRPMTEAQERYLARLARLAVEEVPIGLTRAEAREQIARLRRELTGE